MTLPPGVSAVAPWRSMLPALLGRTAHGRPVGQAAAAGRRHRSADPVRWFDPTLSIVRLADTNLSELETPGDANGPCAAPLMAPPAHAPPGTTVAHDNAKSTGTVVAPGRSGMHLRDREGDISGHQSGRPMTKARPSDGRPWSNLPMPSIGDRRFTPLAVCLGLGVLLLGAGCGGGSSPTTSTSAPTVVPTPAPSPTPTTTPAGETLTGGWQGTLTETQPDGCVQDHALTFDLTHSGSAVSGSGVAVVGPRTCRDALGASIPGPVSGSVNGAAVQLVFQNAKMTGTVSGNTMSGTFSTTEGDQGTWSITRQSAGAAGGPRTFN
jgi:hypothetical protein